MAADAGKRARRTAAGEDALLQGFQRLCEQLGRPCAEAEIRAAAPLPEAGMDLRCLLVAAKRLGFKVHHERLRRRNLDAIPTPFLILGKNPGEVRLVRARAGDHLVLVDPLTGETGAHPPAVVARLGATAVLMKPLAEATHRGLWRESIQGRLRPVLWELGIASVVINLLALAMPLFLMTVYNKVVNHAALNTLDVLALGMLSLLAFEWLLRSLRGYIASHTGARLDAAIGSEVVHHLVHQPYRAFEAMPSGQILERLRQLDALRQFFTSQMPLLLVDVAFVGLFVAVLFLLDVRLGLIVLAVIPVFALLSVLVHRRQKALVEASFKAAAAKSSCMTEAVTQAMTVKALGLEPEMERRFESRLAEAAWTGFRASHVSNLAAASGQALQHLAVLGLIYVGARAIVAGDLSIGALIAATILTARALAPMRQVAGAWQQLQAVRAAFARLDELMAQPSERAPQPSPGLLIRGHVKLEQVSYAYGPAGEPALQDVDLDIRPGTVFGLIGPPGCGKTTVVRLLIGLDRPKEGRVLIDDVDVRLMSPAVLREQLGVVPQEVQLFSGTIAENIAMGARDRSFDRVIAAAKFVGAHDFIQRLPQGYHTPLGERGAGLSSGQRQLISIARALMRNPRVLVLDEATSAIDAASEEYLLANLKRASRGRTIILVTHRLSALSVCDEVAFLVDGGIERLGGAQEVAAYARSRLARHARTGVTGPRLAPVGT
jgi:HlyB family type I secretion system ABC transporter